MTRNSIRRVRSSFARITIGLFVPVALLLPSASATGSDLPVVIRGIPGTPASNELRLSYQASFPNGSLEPSLDRLNAGAMQVGPTAIPDTNPSFDQRPGAVLLSISRPIGLDPDTIPSQTLWATPVNFAAGSIVRIKATFIAPVGPIPGGGFAIGVNAKTGNKDDLPTDTRLAATVNVRPGYLVRFGMPFGSTEPARVVLPQDVKDAIFSTTDPQPFTIEVTVDRTNGKGLAKLMVIDQVFTVPFTLSEFVASGGPAITAVGPGIAVNSNAPGQTASVQVRDFRIYAVPGQ